MVPKSEQPADPVAPQEFDARFAPSLESTEAFPKGSSVNGLNTDPDSMVCQFEVGVLQGQIWRCRGEPQDWTDTAPNEAPAYVANVLEDRLADYPNVELLRLDCSEYPCLAVFEGDPDDTRSVSRSLWPEYIDQYSHSGERDGVLLLVRAVGSGSKPSSGHAGMNRLRMLGRAVRAERDHPKHEVEEEPVQTGCLSQRERLQAELEACAGVSATWPADDEPYLLVQSHTQNLAASMEAMDSAFWSAASIVKMDCAEPPCLAVLDVGYDDVVQLIDDGQWPWQSGGIREFNDGDRTFVGIPLYDKAPSRKQKRRTAFRQDEIGHELRGD